ncbi:hypothetical protein I3760_07G163500 [Carya illinoinensis]|nr:hypothetical protein I3760_07G163500 [Carya illinoinensis]
MELVRNEAALQGITLTLPHLCSPVPCVSSFSHWSWSRSLFRVFQRRPPIGATRSTTPIGATRYSVSVLLGRLGALPPSPSQPHVVSPSLPLLQLVYPTTRRLPLPPSPARRNPTTRKPTTSRLPLLSISHPRNRNPRSTESSIKPDPSIKP